MRLHFLLLVAVILTGCTSPSQTRGIANINGVGPNELGAINVTAGPGVTVSPNSSQSSITVGLSPVAQSTVFQACAQTPCVVANVPRGSILAEGGLLSLRNVSLNAAGPDGDSAVFFRHQGQETGAWLRWNERETRLEASHDLVTEGNATAFGHIGTTTPLQLTGGRVITVSTATIEGFEPTIMARGSASLANGMVRIEFPQAFVALAASAPTVQLTLTTDGPILFVAEKATDHIVVRATGGAMSSASFDWEAKALRKGGESFQP